MISPTFYRATAIASFASAATTLALIFLPRFFPAVDGLEDRMALVADPAYRWRSWIYFAHPFLAFAAALGVALRLRHAAPGPAIVGALGFLAWAFTEAAQQAMTLFAFDRWRVAYATADEAMRASIAARVPIYDGAWDAMFFLLLVAFLIGNLAYAAAFLRGRGLARIVGAFYVGAAFLTLLGISGELGGPTIGGALGFWLYPALQPIARALIGAWLWRNADESSNLAQLEPQVPR